MTRDPARATRAARHAPLPPTLILLTSFIAVIEAGLTLADAGALVDPTLRSRVILSGGFWAGLLRGQTPLFEAQPWTMFLTHALLHGGFLHMAMNMAVLLGLGRFAADRYGPGAILPVFLAGAVGGGAAFGLLGAPTYPMVGASGAVFGFLGVWIAWDWRRHQAMRAPTGPIVRRVAGLAGINVILFFGLGGMLAWEAHLGGFVAGLGCGFWLENRHARAARDRRTRDGARD